MLSALIAGLVSLLIFFVWYPAPYAAVSGGFALFGLLVGVDIVLGPALTAIAASPGKPWPVLRRDLAFIATVQLAALGYGVYAMALSRPMHMAFEVDRMRVVSIAEIDADTLSEAPEGFRSLPWFGPRLIAAVLPTDPAEKLKAMDLGVAGFDLAMVPRYWRDYTSRADEAWRIARPVSLLIQKYPQTASEIDRIAGGAGVKADELRFLPLISRRVGEWVTLLAEPKARVVGYLPFDGYF